MNRRNGSSDAPQNEGVKPPPHGSEGQGLGAAPAQKPRNSPLLRIVGLLIFMTGSLVVWVTVATVRASHDRSVRSGLDYQAFLDAVDDLTEGAGDSLLLVFQPVEERLPNRQVVRYDTIEIIADVEAFPAFQEAGFLYDQVQIYNTFQRERLDLAQVDPEWFLRLTAFNPSVFRPYRRPDGSQGLTRGTSAWSLRVRSPLEGDWNGEILARDVHRGQGLVSPRVAVPLRKPIRLTRTVEGRRQLCEFVPKSFDVIAYCLSEERIPQATFRLASDERTPEWAVAGWADLWVDGRRVRSGDSVGIQGGTVLRLNPLEPVVFADYWEGVLSSKQWVNGRMRRRTALPPPFDIFSALGWGPASYQTGVSPSASIGLSVEAEASAELTQLLDEFLKEELDVPLDFGMIVLARIPDGSIVAVGEVGERRNRGRSSLLERVAPGSAVKPLLAAAILSQRPALAELKIRARSGPVTSVLGMPDVPPRRAFTTALNCAAPDDGWIDLRYFLRCSNNEFAASLLIAGLEDPEAGGNSSGRRPAIPLDRGLVPRASLLRSPLSAGMNALFGLPTDPVIADSMGRSRRVWEGLTFSDGTPVNVPNEVLPSGSRPALLAPGSRDGTELGLLYRYAIGAWENQWNLLDLTTGFARVVSDRRVQLRFHDSRQGGGRFGRFGGEGRMAERSADSIPGGDGGGDGAGHPGSENPSGDSAGIGSGDGLGFAGTVWYPELVAGLAAVAEDGTARGLRTAWRRAGLPLRVLAKTGTLAEPGEAGPRDDLFAKSLLFSVGETVSGGPGPMRCGLVGGIYLRFSEGPRRGALPSYQVTFAREKLGDFLRKHWETFGGCEEPEAGGGV